MKKVLIAGGGLLGLAIAYHLSRDSRNYQVTLIEKEKGFGRHQSGNNSGVLHCGLYYQPGSLKAKLAVQGIREMVSFCELHQVNHEICGKVVVATNDYESKLLNDLIKRGQANGLSGLKLLSDAELKQREPHVSAVGALLVPEEGIVDFKQVMAELERSILAHEGKIIYGCDANDAVNVVGEQILLQTEDLEDNFDLFINCAGLHSDRLYSKIAGKAAPLKIVPFRGEYMHILEDYRDMVNHLVYPVPDPQYPFLGVHFTRMINGEREVGPNAVLAFKREGYRSTDISLFDTYDSLTYSGLVKFISKNMKFAVGEFISSISKKAFISKSKKMIPDMEEYMFKKGGTAGVRAQAISRSGNLMMDFVIEREKNQIHILNAPSPGATASLSIAKYIIQNYI